jgi:hypothetical protein
MTLKEKLQQEQLYINPYTFKLTKEGAENLEIIADEFAINFHQWMRVNDTKENAEKYFHYTDKDMLNEFKKGL